MVNRNLINFHFFKKLKINYVVDTFKGIGPSGMKKWELF